MPCFSRKLALLALWTVTVFFASTAHAQSTLPQLTSQEHQAQYGSMPAIEVLRLSGAGDAYATLEMGNRLATGSGGFPRNQNEAARLYSLAAQTGFPGAPSIDGIGTYPLPPFKTSNPASAPAQPPADPLPIPTLVSTVAEGPLPLSTAVSINPTWSGNAVLYSWEVNQQLVANDAPTLALDFDEPGVQSIVLRVMDQFGRTATASTNINVLEPEVIALPPSLPIPLFPAQDALVFENTTIDFQWEAQQDVDTYDFHFFDGLNRITFPFITDLAAESLCADGICTLTLPMELPLGGTHAWRVRARNAQGLTSWTRNRFSVVEAITEAPGAVLLLGPDNQSVFENEAEVSFGWLPTERAQSYEFLLTDADSNALVSQTLSATTCSDTACTQTVLLALNEFESYQWQVTASNVIGDVSSDVRSLSIIPLATQAPNLPENISPEPRALLTQNSTVTFQWTHDPATATYEFHFFNRTDGEEIHTTNIDPQIVCTDTSCSIDQVIDLPIDIRHAWRVRARNSLGVTTWTRTEFDVVLPVDEPPGAPSAITPLANSFVEADNAVAFTWGKEDLALSYAFEITRDDTVIESATVSQSACGENTCSVNLSLSVDDNENHQWRVQAANDNGTSEWVETPFIVIEAPSAAPEPVTLLTPADGDVLVERTSIAVLWTEAANATSYDILLEDSQTGGDQAIDGLSPLDVCIDNNCTYTLDLNITPGDNHRLRVRGVNSLGRSEWTQITFQVIDDGAPDAPIIVSPLNNSSFAGITELPVRWQAVPFASAYELELLGTDINATIAAASCENTDTNSDALCEYELSLPLTDADTQEFTVQVRVTTPSGTSESANTSFSIITDTNGNAPIAAFTLANFTGDALGAAPLTLTLDPGGSSDDVGIVAFDWVFSDTEEVIHTDTQIPITYTFTEPGDHTVTLTVTDAEGLTSQASRQINVFDPSNTLSELEASRLLTQATFGTTEEGLLELRALGVDAWLQQQFSLQSPDHLDYVNVHSNGSGRAPRHEIWWRDVVEGDDQLRQRVAFALSELFVVSDIGYTLANSQYGVTHFYDQLRNNAFGNYRELLEIVTKSPVMGLYLSMLQNEKANEEASTRPDENYAREVLQLFSIGVDELNLDGTPTGNPGYTQANVEEFARVFTGWNYKNAGRWDRGLNTGQDLISPMEPFEEFHDTGSKTLLNGEVIPAGLSAQEDLDRALDNIANHQNVGPFIAKHLIQRLTTSNPTPQYVARVATAFNDNGQGVRGDLQAVVKAVLMDSEARTTNRPAHFGKLREPVIRISNLWRAFSISPGTGNTPRGEYNTGSPQLENLDLATGQAVLKSPSVFNFFKPEFAAIGPVSANNLVSPEFEVMTESTEIATTNRIGDQINRYFEGTSDSVGTRLSFLNFDTELALADDADDLVDHLDVLLMAGTMSPELRTQLTVHVDALPDTPAGLSTRVRDAVTLIMASPDYLIQQ